MAILEVQDVDDELLKASAELRRRIKKIKDAIATMEEQYTGLAGMNITYADLAETVNQAGYGDTDANEASNKAHFTAILAIRNAKRDAVEDINNWIDANVTEFD